MSHAKNTEPHLESSVCGLLHEPLAFWQFRMVAGTPDAGRVKSIRDIERLSFATRDGRKLGGYKLRADTNSPGANLEREAGPAGASPKDGASAPQGYLLVAQGNDRLADQIWVCWRSSGMRGWMSTFTTTGVTGFPKARAG